MQHAYQAILIVQTKLLNDFLPTYADTKAASPVLPSSESLAPKDEKDKKDISKDYSQQIEYRDRVSVLTIAYHNLAVEQEFLKMFSEGLQSYHMAWQFAQRHLGEKDGITINLKNVHDRAAQSIEKTKVRTQEQHARHELLRQKQRAMSGKMRNKMQQGHHIQSMNPVKSRQQQQVLLAASHNYRINKLQALQSHHQEHTASPDERPEFFVDFNVEDQREMNRTATKKSSMKTKSSFSFASPCNRQSTHLSKTGSQFNSQRKLSRIPSQQDGYFMPRKLQSNLMMQQKQHSLMTPIIGGQNFGNSKPKRGKTLGNKALAFQQQQFAGQPQVMPNAIHPQHSAPGMLDLDQATPTITEQ